MPDLFEPTIINAMTLSNRFVRSATYDAMAGEDGACTTELINSMARLSEGGVGLIIAGAAYVSRDCHHGPGQMGADRRDLLPGLFEMTEAVHSRGGKIGLQIYHAGPHPSPQPMGSTPFAPSPGYDPSLEMTSDQIDAIVGSFANAAGLAKEAGFDAVQIHAAHGALLSEFLSPYFNKRRDGYGGGIENRARVLIDVLRSIRESVGRGYPILAKINCDDYLEGGFGTDDMLASASMLEDAGIDAIELSGGTFLPSGRFSPIRPGKIKPEDEGYYRAAAMRFKEEIGVPLMLTGGIRSYQTAKRFIEQGVADYITLSRPLICEPELINRWKSGDVRPSDCISDNLCLKSLLEGNKLRCELRDLNYH